MDKTLVYYTGKHLGRAPRTVLRGGTQHVDWTRRVRALPAADAADLLQTPASFLPALPIADAAKKWSISGERLAELGAAGKIHVETYQLRGQEPALAVVPDELTDAGIAAERKAAKAKAKKEEG